MDFYRAVRLSGFVIFKYKVLLFYKNVIFKCGFFRPLQTTRCRSWFKATDRDFEREQWCDCSHVISQEFRKMKHQLTQRTYKKNIKVTKIDTTRSKKSSI